MALNRDSLPGAKALTNPGTTPPDEADLDQRLQAAQRMESIGVLACGLVHDFNNALSVMIGQAQIMDAVGGGESAARLEKIVNSGKRAAALAAQILEIGHWQSEPYAPLLLSPLLKESMKLLGAYFSPAITSSVTISDHNLVARVSPTGFHQMVFNLCINAVEAMPEGGHVDVRLRRIGNSDAGVTGAAADWVSLEVSDQGRGINDEIRASIFAPFFTTKPNGTGLGLTMVASVARESGGRVEVESTSAQGSRFRVLMPVAESRTCPQAVSTPVPRGRGQNILVVDDILEITCMLKAMLTINGYQALTLNHANEVMACLERPVPAIDLVLLDVAMPGKNGCQLAAYIAAHHPTLPLILMSGCGRTQAVEAALAWGHAQGFLAKPFMDSTFLALVAELLSPQVLS